MHYNDYLPIQKRLHWLIAALVLIMLCIGFSFNWIPSDMAFKPPLRNFHKVLGLLILLLVCIRIFYRLKYMPKAAKIPLWMQYASHTSHGLLYLCILFMPLSGWIMSSASRHMPSWFPVFIPGIPRSNTLGQLFYNIHSWLGYTLALVVTLHILATLYHVYRRDHVLERMLG